MSNQHKTKRQPPAHTHVWEVAERKLDDGFSYKYLVCKVCHDVLFPGPQLQKLYDYSQKNLFLFVEDWVLLLLYAGHERTEYITGITRFQKMLFLIFKEFAQEHKIPTENPGFYGYLYGPFSSRIDEAIEFLIEMGDISTEGRKSTSSEHFIITNIGKEHGKQIFEKLTMDQQEALKAFRHYWDSKSVLSLCKYVYANYEEYTTKSLILNQVFPGRKLHRKRSEGPKIAQSDLESVTIQEA